MNIIEAYKEAKKSTYKIINADKTRIIDFNHMFENVIINYDEKGKFIDTNKICDLGNFYVRQLLDIVAEDDREVAE